MFLKKYLHFVSMFLLTALGLASTSVTAAYMDFSGWRRDGYYGTSLSITGQIYLPDDTPIGFTSEVVLQHLTITPQLANGQQNVFPMFTTSGFEFVELRVEDVFIGKLAFGNFYWNGTSFYPSGESPYFPTYTDQNGGNWIFAGLSYFGTYYMAVPTFTYAFQHSFEFGSGQIFSGGAIQQSASNSNPVPIPATIWLFGSALAGLGIVGKRRAKRILA